MSINNIHAAGNVTAVAPIHLETTDQTMTRESVHSRQSTGEQTATASQAVQVALESLASSELNQLAQTIATRTALMSKLPPELKELVQKILNQTQAMQTSLPAGLAALLTSSRSAGEKLSLLAALLEEAAGADTKAGELSQGNPAGKQQVTAEFFTTLRNSKPEELKTAIKMLKELAMAVKQTDNKAVQQATTSLLKQVPTSQQQSSAMQPSSQLTGNQQGAVAPEAGRQPVMPQGTSSQPAGVMKEAADAPVPAGVRKETPDASQSALRMAENPDLSQSKHGETENRPLHLQKPNHMATESKQQAGGLLVSDRRDNTASKQQAAPGVPVRSGDTPERQPVAVRSGGTPEQQPAAVRSGRTSEQEAAAVLTRLLADRPEIMKSMPAVIKEYIQTMLRQAESTKSVTTHMPEPLATLLKSPQPLAEKMTMLARMLEEAVGLFKPEGRFALQTAVGGQQVLAEVINAWRNKNQEDIKFAAKALRQLAETMTNMAKTSGVLAERQLSHSILSFTVPLYFGDGQSVYPAHIHVYYQKEDNKKNPGQQVHEIWLRICLETENIGTVETAFRLYDGQNLDVKVKFNDNEAADCFADSIPAIKQQLGQLPFHLGELLVR